MISGIVAAGALLAWVVGSRLGSRRNLTVLQQRLMKDLKTGVDLGPITRNLLVAVDGTIESRIFRRRSGTAAMTSEGIDTQPELELRLLYAIATMESLRLDLAEAELDRRLLKDHPGVALLGCRLRILHGGQDTSTLSFDPKSRSVLGSWLVSDTYAQLALLDDRGADVVATLADLLPTTRARLLCVVGRNAEALDTMRSMAPSRVDALCRAFPADPATQLWLTRRSGPYR